MLIPFLYMIPTNPLLAFKRPERRDILREFQRSHVTAAVIAHGKITNMNERVPDMNLSS
ncbi:hypothetical protein [Paenibacillus sophorae]|uniref:hypothetical protein n=1 Tax=Paenibacillus sophorae TaxID=1333845 RepID=UPI0004BC6AC4|nr:hypothetical protein [Paenibacillus sophorae]